MPLFTNSDKVNIAAGHLAGFTKAHRYHRDAQGNTLLHLLIKHRRPLPEIQDAIARLQLPIHAFNFVSVSTCEDIKDFQTPIDLCLSRNDHYHNTLVYWLLHQPIVISLEDLKNQLGIVFPEWRKAMQETAVSITGFVASQLAGADVHNILNDCGMPAADPTKKKDSRAKYQAHLLQFSGKSAHLGQLEGFFPLPFLALRIYSMIDLFFRVYGGVLDNTELPPYEGDFTTLSSLEQVRYFRETRQEIANELLSAIKRDIETRLVQHYGDQFLRFSTSWGIGGNIRKNALLGALTVGVRLAILQLNPDQSIILYTGWKGHAIYTHIQKTEEDAWHILVHNLGQGTDIHPEQPLGSHRRKPYPVGKVTRAMLEEGGVVSTYLQAVLQRLFPAKPLADMRPVIYDLDEDNHVKVFPLLSDEEKAAFGSTHEPICQQAVGNCVAENHSAASCYSMRQGIYKWISAQELGGICFYGITYYYPPRANLSSLPLTLLPNAPRERGDWHPADLRIYQRELKSYYQANCALIPGIWAEDVRLPMDTYYVQLTLAKKRKPRVEALAGFESLEDVNDIGEYDISDSGQPYAESIPLEALAMKKGQYVVVGDPGYGKSTLLQCVAYRWSQGEWGELYQQVFLIPLKELKAALKDFRPSMALRGAGPAEIITDFIHHRFFNEIVPEGFLATASHLFTQETTLFLLDGADELGTDALIEGTLKSIMDFLKSKPYIIISSRPSFLHDVSVGYEQVNILGLSDEQVIDTVRRLKRGESRDKLLKMLQEHSNIWSLVHSPMMLKLACLSYNEHVNTKSAMYQAFEEVCRQRHIRRFLPDLIPPEPIALMSPVAKAAFESEKQQREAAFWAVIDGGLCALAMHALEENDGIISTAKLEEILASSDARSTLLEEFIESDYLRPIDAPIAHERGRQRAFLHQDFMGYFAAKAVLKMLKTWPPKAFQDWFKARKLHEQYQSVWRFVSGMVDNQPLADRWLNLVMGAPWCIVPPQAEMQRLAQNLAEFGNLDLLSKRKKLSTHLKRAVLKYYPFDKEGLRSAKLREATVAAYRSLQPRDSLLRSKLLTIIATNTSLTSGHVWVADLVRSAMEALVELGAHDDVHQVLLAKLQDGSLGNRSKNYVIDTLISLGYRDEVLCHYLLLSGENYSRSFKELVYVLIEAGFKNKAVCKYLLTKLKEDRGENAGYIAFALCKLGFKNEAINGILAKLSEYQLTFSDSFLYFMEGHAFHQLMNWQSFQIPKEESHQKARILTSIYLPELGLRDEAIRIRLLKNLNSYDFRIALSAASAMISLGFSQGVKSCLLKIIDSNNIWYVKIFAVELLCAIDIHYDASWLRDILLDRIRNGNEEEKGIAYQVLLHARVVLAPNFQGDVSVSKAVLLDRLRAGGVKEKIDAAKGLIRLGIKNEVVRDALLELLSDSSVYVQAVSALVNLGLKDAIICDRLLERLASLDEWLSWGYSTILNALSELGFNDEYVHNKLLTLLKNEIERLALPTDRTSVHTKLELATTLVAMGCKDDAINSALLSILNLPINRYRDIDACNHVRTTAIKALAQLGVKEGRDILLSDILRDNGYFRRNNWRGYQSNDYSALVKLGIAIIDNFEVLMSLPPDFTCKILPYFDLLLHSPSCQIFAPELTDGGQREEKATVSRETVSSFFQPEPPLASRSDISLSAEFKADVASLLTAGNRFLLEQEENHCVIVCLDDTAPRAPLIKAKNSLIASMQGEIKESLEEKTYTIHAPSTHFATALFQALKQLSPNRTSWAEAASIDGRAECVIS